MNAGSPSGTPETRMPLERCDGRLLPRPHRGALRPSSAPRQQSSMEQPASEPSGSAEAAQGSDAPTTPEAADGAAAVDWRTDGSDFVGRRVYRTVTSEDGFLRRVEGVVVGWLSAAESDFFDACGAPAALYRVAYDGGELADDAEDLEEHEVEERRCGRVRLAGVIRADLVLCARASGPRTRGRKSRRGPMARRPPT